MTSSAGRAITVFLSLIACDAFADENLVWVEYPESGVVLGQGYNLLEDRPATGTCVDFVPIQDPSQSIQYKFDEVTSQTQVQSTTNISASGSMRMAILKASARLSFLSDETFKLETQKFLLSASVVNSSLFAAPSVDFKKGGAVVRQPAGKSDDNKDYGTYTKIAMKSDSDRLNVEKCGQGFVSAIVSGASLDAFLTMAKTDATSLANVKGSLEADIGGIFTVSGNFEQKQTSASVQQKTSVSVYKTGGNSSKIAYDLAGLKASVLAMPLEASTSPKPIRIAILPYEFLDKLPEKKSYTAQLYGQAIAAFFLAKDVFQRTASVIELYDGLSDAPAEGQPFFIQDDINTYLLLNSRALTSTNRLSTMLELCQGEVARGNEALGADTSGASAGAVTIKLFSALGSLPSNEGQRPTTRELNNLGAISQALDAEYSKFSSALSPGGVGASGTPIPAASSQLTNCNPNSEGSFFRKAVDEAIALAAEEISFRPIFWSELGINYREKLMPFIEKVGGTDKVDKMTEEALNALNEYNSLHRSSRLIRETCEKTFSHPLCAVDYMLFVERSKLRITEGDVRFTQLSFDAK